MSQENTGPKIAGDVFFNGLSRAVLTLFGLVTIPLLTKTLTPEAYGAWVQIWATIGLILPFATFGFQSSTVRFLSGSEDDDEVSRLFHMMLLTIIAACSALALASLAFRGPLSNIIFADPSFGSLVPLAGLLLAASAFFEMDLSFMRARKRIKLLSIANVADACAKIGALYLALAASNWGLQAAIQIYIALLLTLSGILYITQVVKSVGIHLSSENLMGVLRELLAFSLPLVPTSALMWVLSSSDRYFIVHWIGLSENATYSIAYGLVSTLALFYMPLGMVVYPVVVGMWDGERRDGVRLVFERGVKAYEYLVIPAILGLAVLGPRIIELLATDEYRASPLLILALASGIFFLGIYQINVYIIHLTKKTYYNTAVSLIAAFVNIALNYLLIGPMGIYGAAVSTLLSYAFLAGAVTYVARREVRYSGDIAFTIKCLAASLVMAWAIQRIDLESISSVFAAIAVGTAIYIPLTIILRCFSKEELKEVAAVLGLKAKERIR